MTRRLLCPLLLLLCLPATVLCAKDEKPAAKPEKKPVKKEKVDENAMTYASQFHWGDWVEKDFPFFSSVLDARDVGKDFPKDNLTPRGLILNLGHGMWACFDTDLLRIACIWQEESGKPPITLNALAPGSYIVAGQKTKDGQDDLPTPVGKVFLANGIYPGWQVGEKPSLSDPRPSSESKEEVGKGPLTDAQLVSIRPKNDRVVIELNVDGAAVTETLFTTPKGLQIDVQLGPTRQVLSWVAGVVNPQMTNIMVSNDTPGIGGTETATITGQLNFTFSSSTAVQSMHLSFPGNGAGPAPGKSGEAAGPRWPQTVTTKGTLSQKDDAYVVDDIALPLENPWHRNVRFADIAFLDDQGHAAAVTMDGDVWMISGLKGDLEKVEWKRFASGLHEPMSIVFRPHSPVRPAPNEALFVFDRDGIWKLVDTDHDGECDRYEMFCNLFGQTAETREFPNSMKLAPDGSLVISKGGQQGTTLGKHNGTVIRIAEHGKTIDVLGYGLRQPFVGVHPRTGTIVASDQEGNYVPTTPIQIIRDHQFYGHLATIQPHEQFPQTIADPLTWIPHSVVPSGATLTWLTKAKLGSVNNELILVSYNKPELHRVLECTASDKPQAAVVPWIKNLDFPTLNAHVNPADGQLYVIGFQIWGTTVKKISGLARVRFTGKPRVLLTGCTPCDKGVLLRFNLPLDKAAATNPDNFNVERWNYKRTFNYGSPHLKPDGTPGQEWMAPSSAYLSKDGTKVFVGLPDMKTTYMQMRVGYGLKGVEGLPAQNNAYLTPYELVKFEPEKEGFDRLTVDLTPRKIAAAEQVKPTLEEGKRLYEMMGCMACHSIDGTTYAKVGPSWKGLYNSERVLAKGGDKAMADEIYLKESIQNPPAKVVKGYEKLDAGMPIYAGVLNDSQIDSLILFIKSLK